MVAVPERTEPPTTPRVQIQTVLHRTAVPDVWRWFRGVVATQRDAARRGLIAADLAIALADVSPVPCLTAEAVTDLASAAATHGIALRYEPPVERSAAAAVTQGGGPAAGSAGARRARAHDAIAAAADERDILVLSEANCYPSPGALATLATALEDASVGVAEARQIPFGPAKDYDAVSGDTSYAGLVFTAVRRSVFEQVGGLDAGPLHERHDVDLSWRIRAAGWRVVHVPRATVFSDRRLHAGGTELAPTVSIGDEPGAAQRAAREVALHDRAVLAARYGATAVRMAALAELASLPGARRARLARAARVGGRTALDVASPEPIERGAHVATFTADGYAPVRY